MPGPHSSVGDRLDRHMLGGRGDRVAFHWRGEEGEERDLTYAELLADVQRLARSGKIMRRLLRDVAEGREPGDVTTLRDASVLTQLQQTAAPDQPKETT